MTGLLGALRGIRAASPDMAMSRAARAVLKHLLNTMIGGASVEVFPKHATLAAKADYSVSTVQRALVELEARGTIVRRQRFRRWRNGCARMVSSGYRISRSLLRAFLGSVKMTEHQVSKPNLLGLGTAVSGAVSLKRSSERAESYGQLGKAMLAGGEWPLGERARC